MQAKKRSTRGGGAADSGSRTSKGVGAVDSGAAPVQHAVATNRLLSGGALLPVQWRDFPEVMACSDGAAILAAVMAQGSNLGSGTTWRRDSPRRAPLRSNPAVRRLLLTPVRHSPLPVQPASWRKQPPEQLHPDVARFHNEQRLTNFPGAAPSQWRWRLPDRASGLACVMCVWLHTYECIRPVLLPHLGVRFDKISKKGTLNGYFLWLIVGYAFGLFLTYLALYLMDGHGQPALLYLVPCTLGLTLILGCVRGELGELWNHGKKQSNSNSSQV